MNVSILGPNAFQTARVELSPGETFQSEAGKMVRMSANIDVDVSTTQNSGGGIMGGLKRLLAGQSFFLATYCAQGGPGEVVLSPLLSGNVKVLDVQASVGWYAAGGSYLGSSSELQAQPKWQGMKGLFSGENMVFIHCAGNGQLMVDAFGMITAHQVDGTFIVDTGHVVAFEDTLEYEISKLGGSWLTTFLSGEGLVIRFKGRGTVLVQSHNRDEFGSDIGPRLPEREA